MVLAVTNGTNMIEPWMMQVGIEFGDYEIAVREKYNPDDSSGWVQAFEHRIEKAYRKYGDMTDNQLRRMVSPHKCKGGYGPFRQANTNLRFCGVVVMTGRTERAPKYGLADGRTKAVTR